MATHPQFMKEYVLPITFRTVDNCIDSLIMNLYLPIPEVYNQSTIEERYKMYAIFLMANIHNLVKWLNCKPRETYIAKITNIQIEKNIISSISCEEMVRIIKRDRPCSRPLVSSTYIIIFSGDSIMNTASLDIYPLKFNIYISLGLSYYMRELSNKVFAPIYIKNLMINDPKVEQYVMEYGKEITNLLLLFYGADIINIIQQYYEWNFCSDRCKFIW